MASYSALCFSPYCVYLYRWINSNMALGGLANAFKRGAVGNLAMSPVSNAVFFFYSTHVEHWFNVPLDVPLRASNKTPFEVRTLGRAV